MSFNWEEKSLLWGNLHGDHSPAPSALPLQPSQRVRLSVPAASPLLRAELGFLIRSGQNTAVVSLDCEPLKWGAPRLWVSGGLFRQGELEDDGKQLGNEGLAADPKSWDCWGSWLFSSCLGLLQVCVLGSCRMGGGGGVGMWLLPQGRKVFKAASVSVLHTLCARGPFLLSCCASEGLPCPAAVEGDFLLSALAAKQRPVLLLL